MAEDSQIGSNSSSNSSQDGLDVVFNRFSVMIDAKFVEFGKQLLEKSETKMEQAMKKAKRESYTCKKKGNQQQLDFATNVLEKLEDAKDLLASNSTEGAKRKVSEGADLVQKRVKAIKLADKSEYGWATVNEYLSDELASDTDDEKRIYRSEKRAEKKYKDKQRQRLRNVSKSTPPSSLQAPRGLQALGVGRKLGPCFKISIFHFFLYLLYSLRLYEQSLIRSNTIFKMYALFSVFNSVD